MGLSYPAQLCSLPTSVVLDCGFAFGELSPAQPMGADLRISSFTFLPEPVLVGGFRRASSLRLHSCLLEIASCTKAKGSAVLPTHPEP